MLDTLTLTYMELSRSAKHLALRLERIATGQTNPSDKEAIHRAAEALANLLASGKLLKDLAPSSPLFGTAEGLDIVFEVLQSPDWGLGLDALGSRLSELQRVLPTDSKQVKEESSTLARLFDTVASEAEERAAMRQSATAHI
jgi:hypothetical protein